MADTIRVTPKELQDKARMMENAGNDICWTGIRRLHLWPGLSVTRIFFSL